MVRMSRISTDAFILDALVIHDLERHISLL